MRLVTLAVGAVLALALPSAAAADTLALTPPADSVTIGSPAPIQVDYNTSASSFIFAYAVPFALPTCPPSAAIMTTAPGVVTLSPPGGFFVSGGNNLFAPFTPSSVGSWVVCAYVATSESAVPSATGRTGFDVVERTPLPVPGPLPGPVIPEEPVVPDVPDVPDVVRTPTERAGHLFSRLHHHMFGTLPLPISIGSSHKPANGDSGGAAVSGDNRKMRLAAFHSTASNLVAGDSNGKSDVFVWQRPRGRAGLVLNHLGGNLRRVSVNNSGQQANGDSTNPSLDGSITSVPHCVAFQSTATNLAGGDSDSTSDIFVRDLRTKHTYLVSGGVGPAATSPSIDGHCRSVAFAAGGAVFTGSAHGGRGHRLSGGGQPDYSLDGSALVWARGGSVFIRRNGATSKVGPGSNPRVSDNESGIWGIVFDTKARLKGSDHDSHVDVYTRVVHGRGGPSRTDLISSAGGTNAYNGGITAYGANRGIIVFGIEEGAGSGLWYRNNHTGNIDDLAFTTEA